MASGSTIFPNRSHRIDQVFSFFFFNDTATTEIYPLSLHDALPISRARTTLPRVVFCSVASFMPFASVRSEEHTSELQSHSELVCRLRLEKKKRPRCDPTRPSPDQGRDERDRGRRRRQPRRESGRRPGGPSRRWLEPPPAPALFLLMTRRRSTTTRFPYTTLFR